MDLRNIAKDYNEAFGFNVIPLENKVPKFEWKKYQIDEMTNENIDNLNWNHKTNGIGAISGVNELRCLDFDAVQDDNIIYKFVERLGFARDYSWVVKSGSGKGYHIWFLCCDDDNYLDGLGGEKSYYKFNLKENNLCDHIELRWKNCQTVLPPSLHPSGNKYVFVNLDNDGLPRDEPSNIWIGKLLEVVKELCVIDTSTPLSMKDVKRKTKDGKGKEQKKFKVLKDYEKELLKKASHKIKGKIDNYDDYMMIGFALASLAETGRRYFIKISSDNPKYPKDTDDILNRKFDGFVNDYRGDVTLGSFFEIAKKYGWVKPVKRFWYILNNKAQLNVSDLLELLEEEGFGKILIDKTALFVKVTENIVSEVNSIIIKDFILAYIEKEIKKSRTKKLVKEKVISSASRLFSDATLECLQTFNLKLQKDAKDKSYFYYKNCFVEVSKDKTNVKPYNELNGMVWENQRMDRKFSRGDSNTVFAKFLVNVCDGDDKRYNSLVTAIGYLLHRYKNPTVTKAIIFIDEMLSENAFGRSGKGLVANAIKQMRSLLKEDGKNFKFDNSFAFQKITLDTEILFFDDVDKKFQFERLFSIITEGIDVERKNKNKINIPFEDSPKILISTNYSVQGSDGSSKDRQFVVEFADHYNDRHKPIDEFYKNFFVEWNDEEYLQFDNFMIECSQYYLRNGLKEYAYVNLIKKQLIDESCTEFEEYIKDVELGIEHNKKNLFNQFKETYEDYSKMRQNTFTKWTKVYANLYDLDVHQRKSGAERFIALTKKGVKLQIE